MWFSEENVSWHYNDKVLGIAKMLLGGAFQISRVFPSLDIGNVQSIGYLQQIY